MDTAHKETGHDTQTEMDKIHKEKWTRSTTENGHEPQTEKKRTTHKKGRIDFAVSGNVRIIKRGFAAGACVLTSNEG